MKDEKSTIKNTFSGYDGKEIKDSLGRIIKLRKPKILDKYYLEKALEDDAENVRCLLRMSFIPYVFSIDGQIFEQPRTKNECLAALSKLEEEGCNAIAKEIYDAQDGDIEDVKK